jgi:putative tetracenomycin polyketide synthesis O-methyltransferase tcmP
LVCFGLKGVNLDLSAVSKTLFIPLSARIFASKNFPEYFYDEKALSLEKIVQTNCESVQEKSSEYALMASAARYYNMDEIVRKFCAKYSKCNVVYLGAGLETACFRLKITNAAFYEIDLPEVIELRWRVLGECANEALVGCDMFDMAWARRIDESLPTLFVACGVFQYFTRERVLNLIRELKNIFKNAELVFDATNEAGLKYANKYVKSIGNDDAIMRFCVDDGRKFALEAGVNLIEERVFFVGARKMLSRRLKFTTRLIMKFVDFTKRAKILHFDLKC